MSTNTPNTIDLYLMENRSIMAKVNGYPIGNQNGYLIIAGEENATQFKIASIPDIYSGYTLSVEMVNSRGAGIEEKEIEDNTFVLPEGMAVAGYGQIQIYAKKTVSGREIKVPFNLIRVKVSNTISTWEESISPGAVESAKKSAAEAKSYAESAKKDSESAATAASVAESSKEAAESAAQEATQSAQSAAESASTAQNAAEEAVNTLEGKADLAGNNDFTGENTFEEAIQAKKGTVVKNSLDETNYNAGYISRNDWTYLFPADSGTFALTKNIPTDYATQTALANTQRQVDGLYTLLEQKNEIYVQTATDTYTTRETAGGENIADGVQTPVKKITGKTVKTTNLIPFPYADGMSKTVNGVTFTVNTDGAITINGTATGFASFIFSTGADKINFIGGMTYYFSCRHGIISYLTEEGSETNYIFSDSNPSFTWGEGWIFQSIYMQLNEGQTADNLTVYPMLNEGSTAKPYMPYFSGLKNAFFKEIVSTGRNLIPYPYSDGMSKTINGITFTVNNNGSVTINGINNSENDSTFFLMRNGNLSVGAYSFGLNVSDLEFSIIAYIKRKDGANDYLKNTFTINEGDILRSLYILARPNKQYVNFVVCPMLNYGSSAFPYEPYTKSVLFLPEAVENGEWNTIDIENGKNISQGFTKTFDGTEEWNIFNVETVETGYILFRVEINPRGDSNTNNLLCTNYPFVAYNWSVKDGKNSISIDTDGVTIIIKQKQYMTISDWKTYLAALHTSGNPLVVRYKTREIQSETDISPSADSYIAWKNGSETIEQGDTDNSIYGAENTVEQDYYLLTAPQEVTKE